MSEPYVSEAGAMPSGVAAYTEDDVARRVDALWAQLRTARAGVGREGAVMMAMEAARHEGATRCDVGLLEGGGVRIAYDRRAWGAAGRNGALALASTFGKVGLRDGGGVQVLERHTSPTRAQQAYDRMSELRGRWSKGDHGIEIYDEGGDPATWEAAVRAAATHQAMAVRWCGEPVHTRSVLEGAARIRQRGNATLGVKADVPGEEDPVDLVEGTVPRRAGVAAGHGRHVAALVAGDAGTGMAHDAYELLAEATAAKGGEEPPALGLERWTGGRGARSDAWVVAPMEMVRRTPLLVDTAARVLAMGAYARTVGIEDPALEGEPWYEGLPRLIDVQREVVVAEGGQVQVLGGEEADAYEVEGLDPDRDTRVHSIVAEAAYQVPRDRGRGPQRTRAALPAMAVACTDRCSGAVLLVTSAAGEGSEAAKRLHAMVQGLHGRLGVAHDPDARHEGFMQAWAPTVGDRLARVEGLHRRMKEWAGQWLFHGERLEAEVTAEGSMSVSVQDAKA